MTPHQLAVFGSRAFGVPLFDLNAFELEQVDKAYFDAKIAQTRRVLPLYKRGNRLYVAISDPANLQALEEVRFKTNLIVEPVVVEDDKLVRDYVLAQLHSLGYVTLDAANSGEALALVRTGHAFDLLFTDVIMPGINGRQLADEIAKVRPGLRVLFTSGYTENAIIHHGRLDEGVLLLAKPYRKSDMAIMIRKALGD